MEYKETLIKNTYFNIFRNITVAIIGIILIPFMISKMGILEYGMLILVNVFSAGGFASLFDFGFQATMKKYIAQFNANQEHEKIRNLLYMGILCFVIISVLLMVVGIYFIDFIIITINTIPMEYQYSFRIALLATILMYFIHFIKIIYEGFLEGMQNYKFISLLNQINLIKL